MRINTIVVGGGLFGKVIAKKLMADGRSVAILDSNEPWAGSAPAACLMAPGWYASLGKDVYDPALSVLDELYGVQTLTFKVGPVRTAVNWVRPGDVLGMATQAYKATQVEPGRVHTKREVFECDNVVVAAGIWTRELLPSVEVTGKAGIAFLWKRESTLEPTISPWAPYKQLVTFNRGDGLWISDGSAINPENWEDDRRDACLDRCTARDPSLKNKPFIELYGIRPYVKSAKPCLLEEVRPGVWAATGGAKNGTLAAGWCADQLSRRLK